MKWRRETQDKGELEGAKKRCVDFTTFQKRQCDLDCEYQTKSWLDCDTEKEGARKVVTKLKCQVCTEFVEKIKGRKNCNDRWIVGARTFNQPTGKPYFDLWNQQIMSINTRLQLDTGVPHLNTTYSLEVVSVEDDGRERKCYNILFKFQAVETAEKSTTYPIPWALKKATSYMKSFLLTWFGKLYSFVVY